MVKCWTVSWLLTSEVHCDMYWQKWTANVPSLPFQTVLWTKVLMSVNFRVKKPNFYGLKVLSPSYSSSSKNANPEGMKGWRLEGSLDSLPFVPGVGTDSGDLLWNKKRLQGKSYRAAGKPQHFLSASFIIRDTFLWRWLAWLGPYVCFCLPLTSWWQACL